MFFIRKQGVCILAIFVLALPLAAQLTEPSPTPSPTPIEQAIQSTSDAKEIVSRAVAVDRHNWLLAQKYTWQERLVYKRFDKHGKEKSQEIKTLDTSFFYDEPYSRVVKIDDKPLNEKEERKEEEKQQKFIAKYKDESDDARQKRVAKYEKEREEERAFTRDIVNAYDFQMLGADRLEGRDAYVIQAIPRKDFHPTQPHGEMLSKMQGKLWIDKHSYRCIKLDAEVIDTISFGLFLARVHKGSHLIVQWTRVNDEVWLPRHLFLDASARIMLFDNEAFQQESDFSDFKKFSTDTKILPEMHEVEPEVSPTPAQ